MQGRIAFPRIFTFGSVGISCQDFTVIYQHMLKISNNKVASMITDAAELSFFPYLGKVDGIKTILIYRPVS